ncbi:MAG: serine O-acetyltransferase [Rhodocyclaceae bacterium]|nr:serine O-acetyltransferase [Rhodocyclaceae bacterium]MDZ4216462.1 serine O-acetyltransferase [Rhodocyclaceae bacterium]
MNDASLSIAEVVPAEAPPGIFAMLREDVRCIFQRDPAARTTWEVLTTYPGLHALIVHRLAHVLWRHGWRYIARFAAYLARMLTNIDIHPGARIGRRFFIDHGAGVVIGETAEVGHDVTLYHGVTLGGTTWNKGKRHPTLGDGVIVGAGAKILGAITIGPAARVGANSVVVKAVPAGRTVVGIPARLVGERAAALRELDPDNLIDLDHHLIPDPVGKAIGCLLDRIDAMEQELRALRGQTAPPESTCGTCAAGELCCEEHRHLRKEAS